jgi:S-methylmethionine-dependent homocysteine/selenocysteine methylase
MNGQVMLTDSGIETDIIYGVGRDLPDFALFPLLADEEGRGILDRYYRDHLAVAAEHGLGYVLETPSWRSSPDWGSSLGYTQDEIDALDRAGVEYLARLRASHGSETGPVVVSGLLGPRGDGYQVGTAMTVDEARDYHRHQVQVLADAGCDLISACTLTYAAEGAGIALAAREQGSPVVLYVTVETDGRLPDGSSLGEAIRFIDEATEGYVSYFGINCAHPDHFAPTLAEADDDDADWIQRIRALRANASRRSHAELDEADELDAGDPIELAADYRALLDVLPNARVFGGCCGTDVRHIRAIAAVLAPIQG